MSEPSYTIRTGPMAHVYLLTLFLNIASPYLHDELGVKKSLVAIVFLAGPISGLVVQPFIGVLADRSTSRYGRRRPFIIGGGLICVLGVFILGFTRFLSGWFTTDGSGAVRPIKTAS